MKKTIYIDAGHGGRDPGAVYGTLRESALNLKVALAAAAYLKEYDCVTVLSRTADTDTRINTMAATAKSLKAAAVVSIHHNAGGGRGGEAFYWHTHAPSKALAEETVRQFVAVGQRLRGVKPTSPDSRNFGMCRINAGNGIPAILGEFAFIDNAADRAMIDTDEKLTAQGHAYAKAIVAYLKLKKTTPVPAAVHAGDKLALLNTPLYISSTAKQRSRTVNGTYWVYDGIDVRGRLRITNRAAFVGKPRAGNFVTGWVDKGEVLGGRH